MNAESTDKLDDTKLYGDPELNAILEVKRRNEPIGMKSLRKLLHALRPGLARQANLERYGTKWRLRYSICNDKGGCSRRSLVIVEPAAAEMVWKYLASARQEREEGKCELRLRLSYERQVALDAELKMSSIPFRMAAYRPNSPDFQ